MIHFGKVVGFLVVLSWVLMGCSSEEQEGVRIPPLPNMNEGFSTPKALEFLSRAIQQYPDLAENYQKRAEIYLQRSELDAALEDINTAINLKRNTGRYYVTKARILREKKQINEALQAAQRAEILNERNPDVYVLLADLYQRVNQLGKSRQYLARTLQINPYYGEAYFYRGMIAAKLGDTTAALVLFMRTRTLVPGFLGAYQQLSSIYYQQKDYPKALWFAREGLNYYPKDADLHYRRGLAFTHTAQVDSAYAEFNKTLKVEPEHPGANMYAASILFGVQKVVPALKHLRIVEKTSPNYPGLNFLMAQCLEYTGDDDKAMDYYLEEARENPANRKAVGGYWRTRRRQLTNYPYLRQEERYRPGLAVPDKTNGTAEGDTI
ncbi:MULTISPECIES: lipopolysaccharide assembly protein LapB [unclassified Siphonobacter]|uniref:tetratricopeptide repeat protein n=1 Tax=unclassified Siphonobacter TaxID=2635712 RepID=UPI00277D2C60|nr:MULTISPECIES: tetratricopeptide repeat protein [unclassified Siphonobacter]MDQ1088854.1 tetratricopeptide (TPR) repeat protein [Siphonobacter sp. SORGH_AS_1065]MDR6195040.1 tetratricopeptide (TPR) repeat protein [Siphonobacter sp. SORGH_AS_0500]